MQTNGHFLFLIFISLLQDLEKTAHFFDEWLDSGPACMC